MNAILPEKEEKNPVKLNIRRDQEDDRTDAEIRADAFLKTGTVCNARVMRSSHQNGKELDLDACVKTMKATANSVGNGDNSGIDSMLSVQAITLNTIFTSMAEKANSCTYMPLTEVYMKIALKAQTQCRTTLVTLAQIKNPRQIVITKQANISNGLQQVNNTLNQGGEQNELLSHEQEKGERLNSRKRGMAGGSDPAMAAVNKVNRSKNRTRKSPCSSEC